MKTLQLIWILLIPCFLVSCGKGGVNKTTPVASVAFELIKNDKTLLRSLTDSVKISYVDNGATKFANLGVVKLQRSAADTTGVKRYNGLVIDDKTLMGNLSARRDNPVYDFNIYLNGIYMGKIHLDYWQYLNAYPQPSSAYLTFNGIPVQDDRTADYFYWHPGSNINLLVLL